MTMLAAALAFPSISSAQDLRLHGYEHLEPARPLYRADTVSMLIIGDVMMHSRQMEYPFSTFLQNISGRMKAADVAVVNMEFTLAGKPYTGYPAFSAPDGYADYVSDCGADIFLAANNHILDKGSSGLERTMQIYSRMEQDGKIRFTGVSANAEDNAERYPLMVNAGGISLALVNFTYGTNIGGGDAWPKVNKIRKDDISQALTRAERELADFIIVLPHWGIEYELRHSPAQEDLARWLVSRGADAIVGAHPHVVQDSTVISGVPVFYSLGNAVSNMSAPNTQLELAVKLRLVISENGDKSMLPPEATYLWCSLPGFFTDSYATIAVKDFIGRRSIWKNPSDYDKMMATYQRVKSATGVQD